MLAVDEEGRGWTLVQMLRGACSSKQWLTLDVCVIQATPQLWPVLPTRTWLTAWL